MLAEGKGVRREAESEGSLRQNGGGDKRGGAFALPGEICDVARERNCDREVAGSESVKKSGVGECRRLEGCLLPSLSND